MTTKTVKSVEYELSAVDEYGDVTGVIAEESGPGARARIMAALAECGRSAAGYVVERITTKTLIHHAGTSREWSETAGAECETVHAEGAGAEEARA